MFQGQTDIFQIDKSSSNILEIYRIWHLRCFNNIGSSFVTMNHFCSWQHHSLQRWWWELKKLHMDFTFLVIKVSHWTRKCPCLDWWQNAVPIGEVGNKDKTAKLCKDKVRQSFRISCFTDKFVIFSGPVGQRWMPQQYRGTFDDYSGSQLYLLFLNYFGNNLLVLPAYSVNIISFSGLWTSSIYK